MLLKGDRRSNLRKIDILSLIIPNHHKLRSLFLPFVFSASSIWKTGLKKNHSYCHYTCLSTIIVIYYLSSEIAVPFFFKRQLNQLCQEEAIVISKLSYKQYLQKNWLIYSFGKIY